MPILDLQPCMVMQRYRFLDQRLAVSKSCSMILWRSSLSFHDILVNYIDKLEAVICTFRDRNGENYKSAINLVGLCKLRSSYLLALAMHHR